MKTILLSLAVSILALTATSAWATVLYDFELDTIGGHSNAWQRDTSGGYSDNFSATPALSPVRAQAGTKSMACPINFTDKAQYSVINDAIFVNPFPHFDMSASTGVTLYVYVQSGTGNGNPFFPMQAQLYIKTGAGFQGYRSEDFNLVPGQWNRVTLTFASAFVYDGVGNSTTVFHREDVGEVGLHVTGSGYDKGTAVLYVDTVEGATEGDVTAPDAPAFNTASNAGPGNKIDLTWLANGEPDLDHYNIYRGTTSNNFATMALVKSVTGTSAADNSVVDGVPYFYRLTAVDKSGNESGSSIEIAATPSGPASYSPPMKGMTYAIWLPDPFGAVDSKSSLDDMKATGVDYVAIIVTQYMSSLTDNTIFISGTQTPTESSVVTAIHDIHARGMKVLLKPHVDLTNPNLWRGNLTPASVPAWFDSYKAFITFYAGLAHNNGVEMFAVGTELRSMTDRGNDLPANPSGYRLSRWTDIISTIRTAYPELVLTYAANCNAPQDEFSQIEFWDQLDKVGLNAYFPLTNISGPTLGELKKAWSRNKEVKNPLQIIEDWRSYTGKNVILTELGYRSQPLTNTEPNADQGGAPDMSAQDLAYQAAFAAFNHRTNFEGIFWWHWDPFPNNGGGNSNYYVPMDKPVLNTIAANYGGEVTRSFYDFVGTTQSWAADYSQFFDNTLSSPTHSSAEGGILDYPMNLSIHGNGNDVHDVAYLQPAISKDMSGYRGIKAYVKILAGALPINSTSPITCAMVVQTGPNFNWFQSNTFRNLTPGQWREISLDFFSADSYGAGGQHLGNDKVVTETYDVRKIEISISGGKNSSGNTHFYVDNVVARGTGTILGLSFSTGTYSFGQMNASSQAVTTFPVGLENTGNMNLRYRLYCSSSSPAQWGPGLTPAQKQFVLSAQFNSTMPGSFTPSNHALTTTDVPASVTKFAGNNETGTGVMPGDVRHLWLKFQPPNVLSGGDLAPQSISVNVMAEIQ